MKIKKKLATLQRKQDKLTVLIAVGDLSIIGLLEARRNSRPEVSAAAERLLERVGPKKVPPEIVPPPSVPIPESMPGPESERPEHKGCA